MSPGILFRMLAGHLRSGATGLLLSVLLLLAGCGGTYVAPPPAAQAAQSNPVGAQAALNTLVRDVRDEHATGQGLDATLTANARALRVSGFTARYISDEGGVAANGSWPAQVDITWRFGGFDASTAHETVTATFTSGTRSGSAANGRSVGISSFGGGDQRVPLWLTGPLTVRRSSDTLVVVAGNAREAAQYVRLAANAVATVRRVVSWPRPRLVIEVPASEADLEQELQVTQGSYSGVAAVTATDDGTAGHSSPVHVFVNPEAIGSLTTTGAQVVLSHEATHAATNAVGSSNLPEWLLEGFADYVALRNVPLPLSVTARQIRAEVRAQGAPMHLPGPAQFNDQADDFGAEYEAAWLACRTLSDLTGEHRLVELYDRVRDGAPVDSTMRSLDGFGVSHLTAVWQQRLRDLAGR